MGQTPSETLEVLLEAGQVLASTLDLGSVLKTVLELSSRVVGAESASLMLLNEKTQELYFDVALGLGEEASRTRLQMGQGIAGAVALSHVPDIIHDVSRDPRWSRAVDERSGFTTRSILAVPLLLKGRLIGVVEAINKKDGRFDETDRRTLEALAAQAAIAIDNARLFASVKEEKRKLDTVFREMTDGALLIDKEGRVLLANEAARKFFAVGTELTTLDRALRGMTVTPPLSELMGGNATSIELLAVREEPKKLALAGRAMRVQGAADEAAWLCVFRDATEELQREGLKRTFLSLISHKLKTPLAAVTGFSELLVSDLQKDNAPVMTQKAAATIFAQGRKLSNLVEKLLHYTTIESDPALEMKPVAVDDLVAKAVKGLREYLAERKGSVEYAPSTLKVLGDEASLVEVVKNLVENAVKFDNSPEKKVKVWAEAQEGAVLIRVQDHGPGIPPEEQDRIYGKFHQVEASFTGQVEGWGLGLAYVKKVVEMHKGSVSLVSRLGEGATFTLRLPS